MPKYANIFWITMAAVPTNLNQSNLLNSLTRILFTKKFSKNSNLQLDRAKLGSDTKRGVFYLYLPHPASSGHSL